MSPGDTILAALKGSCATACGTTWLGRSPQGDLVFVTRASCVTHADLQRMVSSCRALPCVGSVRYEVDCGDRAIRTVVTPVPDAVGYPATLGRLLVETAALAWSCRVLGWV